MSTAGNGPFQVSVWHGAAGLPFDRQFGLVTNFPLFLLVLPGILVTLRAGVPAAARDPGHRRAPYLVLIATFFQWYAGFSPAARFLAVLVPLFAYPVAALLQRARDWWLTLGAALLGLAGSRPARPDPPPRPPPSRYHPLWTWHRTSTMWSRSACWKRRWATTSAR